MTFVQPYLMFNGNCEEAVKFYEKALGAKVDVMMRFSETPDQPPPGVVPDNWGDKIMHTSFHIGDSMIMASDGCEKDAPGFKGFHLSLSVNTEAEADRAFNALAEDGSVQMPLGQTFWSPRFGMLTDRFGIAWMINLIPADAKRG